MNIAVVDDEKAIREQIKALIRKQGVYFPADAYETGEELLDSKKVYDIVFLDIQMDGMNGIETAKMLRKQNEDTVLIFVTGMKEYVFEAFDVAAFHYLLKPIEESKFKEVFEKAEKEAGKRRERGQGQLLVKAGDRHITLRCRDILYVENRGKKVEIHTKGEMIEIYASMNELEEQLGESFSRCHRGYLVNMAYIAKYSNDRISLSNGEDIYLAQGRYNDFVKAYMRYLRDGGAVYV